MYFCFLSQGRRRNTTAWSLAPGWFPLGCIKSVHLMSHKAVLPIRWPQAYLVAILTLKRFIMSFPWAWCSRNNIGYRSKPVGSKNSDSLPLKRLQSSMDSCTYLFTKDYFVNFNTQATIKTNLYHYLWSSKSASAFLLKFPRGSNVQPMLKITGLW